MRKFLFYEFLQILFIVQQGALSEMKRNSNFHVTPEKRLETGKKVAIHNGFRVWSPEDENELKSLYFEGIPHSKIAVILSRSVCSIRSKVVKMGLTYTEPRRHTFTRNEDLFIKKQYGRMPTTEIAKELSLPVQSIRERAVKRLNLNQLYYGESNPAATISDHDIDLMRDLNDSGLGPTEIAMKMEVSLSHTKRVLNYQARMNGLPDYIFDMSELR